MVIEGFSVVPDVHMEPLSKAGRATKRRVSMRAVAAAAGVSLMTASLAIRDSRKVKLTTRTRVRAIATSMGYVWSPVVSHLMRNIKVGNGAAHQTVAVVVDESFPASYRERLLGSIESRAAQLGYISDRVLLQTAGGCPKSFVEGLKSRGNWGVVLLPGVARTDLGDVLQREGLKVVNAAHSGGGHRIVSVVQDYFADAQRIVGEARKRGFRRCGFIRVGRRIPEGFCSQVEAVVDAWNARTSGSLVPTLASDSVPAEFSVSRWVMANRPDFLLTNAPLEIRSCLLVPGAGGRVRLPIVQIGACGETSTAFAGMLVVPERIGCVAMDVLREMVTRCDSLDPEYSRVVTLDGIWVPSISWRRVQSRDEALASR